jgi:hypothetical protein
MAAPSVWDDWPKFVPGWLAFLATLGAGTRKAWTRRHHVALGLEAESLRSQLISVRALLEENTASSHRFDWFLDEDRMHLGRALRESTARRTDPALRLAITRVADAWDKLCELAPPPEGVVRVRHNPERTELPPKTPQELIDRAAEIRDVALVGLVDVQTALDRLNQLERRTTGR